MQLTFCSPHLVVANAHLRYLSHLPLHLILCVVILLLTTLEQATAPGPPGTFLNTFLTLSVECVFPCVCSRPEDAVNPRHRRVSLPCGVALGPPRYMARSSKLTSRITNPRSLAQNIGSEQQCRTIDRSIGQRNDGERACRR